MSPTLIITLVLAALILLTLPQWGHSKMWGGGYMPPGLVGAMLGAHMYTVVFK